MFKKPVINAVAASVYITVVVSVMSFLSQSMKDKPDTFFAPIVFLSMLTLSVAVMAYLFFYQPVQLFIDGKKKAAVNHFAQTIGVFGAVTVVELILLFAGLI